jgi:hypothetical protein
VLRKADHGGLRTWPGRIHEIDSLQRADSEYNFIEMLAKQKYRDLSGDIPIANPAAASF